jgi:recombination protein RecA
MSTFPSLEAALLAIRKQWGKEAVQRLGDAAIPSVPVISTGSLSVDHALGVGGLPKGRVVEVYGPEASGKTTLCLHAIASCQAAGGLAAFIDAEHALDITYAQQLGVKTDDILLSQPSCGEEALGIVEKLTQSGAVDLIVIDSVAALTPQKELDGEMGDSHVGLHARLMSQALRKLAAVTQKTGTLIVFINQLRMKIGVMFGSPETTTGGNALKFYASVRLDIRRIGQIKQGEEPIGNRTRVKVVKNKLAPPFKSCEVDIIWGKGIDRYRELLDLAVASGIIDKKGAWYSYEGERLGQGQNTVATYLGASDLYPRIYDEVRSLMLPSREEEHAATDSGGV